MSSISYPGTVVHLQRDKPPNPVPIFEQSNETSDVRAWSTAEKHLILILVGKHIIKPQSAFHLSLIAFPFLPFHLFVLPTVKPTVRRCGVDDSVPASRAPTMKTR